MLGVREARGGGGVGGVQVESVGGFITWPGPHQGIGCR